MPPPKEEKKEKHVLRRPLDAAVDGDPNNQMVRESVATALVRKNTMAMSSSQMQQQLTSPISLSPGLLGDPVFGSSFPSVTPGAGSYGTLGTARGSPTNALAASPKAMEASKVMMQKVKGKDALGVIGVGVSVGTIRQIASHLEVRKVASNPPLTFFSNAVFQESGFFDPKSQGGDPNTLPSCGGHSSSSCW